MPAKKSPSKSLRPGDRVSWDSSGGSSVGRIEKKITTTTKIKTHTAKATKKNPQYLVRSEKTNKPAAHKATELRKLK